MKRIVIADDSETARMFVRRCLEIVGFQDDEFVEVTDGSTALRALDEGGADLLVTDLTMSPMDGTELVWKVKSDPRWKHLPVIVVTSAKNVAKEEELLEMGASCVLAKPVSPATMAKTVQDLSLV